MPSPVWLSEKLATLVPAPRQLCFYRSAVLPCARLIVLFVPILQFDFSVFLLSCRIRPYLRVSPVSPVNYYVPWGQQVSLVSNDDRLLSVNSVKLKASITYWYIIRLHLWFIIQLLDYGYALLTDAINSVIFCMNFDLTPRDFTFNFHWANI